MSTIISPLADLVAWAIIHLHTALGALFGPDTGLAWGLSIAILVIIIRLCLVPLFVKQIHAQRKMAEHAPQLAELRKKYKNDKQRLNEETMRYYKENGVNPLSGCFPIIPQMIVFFSLFYVLRSIAEWKKGVKPAYGMTTQLMESAQKATIFGVHLGDKLLFPHTPGMGVGPSIVAVVTVAISATTTFLTVRQTAKRGLMQTGVDPSNPMAQSQKFMQYIVPFFSLTGLYWQYGLVLYWVTTNVWTLGQQYIMFRNWTPLVPATADAPGVEIGAPRGSRTTSATARAAAANVRASGGAKAVPGRTARPAAGGTAKAASGATRTASGDAAKTTSGNTPRTVAGADAKATSAGSRNGTGSGDGRRQRTITPRANGTSGSGSATTSGTASGAVRTGNASRDAAANSPGPANGQNGGVKRSLLRLGKPKQEEPEPEPEAPVAKVVRQQPVRQARSKRSGKR